MADVVCWVQDVGDRLRVTWLSGPATFPPYHLEQAPREELDGLARALQGGLEKLVRENTPHAALELARAGHRLYRLLFQADAQPAAVRAIQQWWEGQWGRPTALHVVGSSPFSGLWHLVYDQEPSEHVFLHEMANGECWKPFWGLRHPLGDGRRVNPLGGQDVLTDPRILLAADNYLPEEERRRLATFAEAHQLPFVATGESLEKAVADVVPDVLYVVRHAGGSLIDAQVYVTGGLAAGLDPLANELPGNRLGARQAMPAMVAGAFVVDFLEAFLFRGESAGAALHRQRQLRGPAGLAFVSSLPPGLSVYRSSDAALPPLSGAEELPLPPSPYRNLRPCEAADRALFVGRDEETLRLGALIDDARAGLVLLHGPTGAGKTSLLQAGVLPFLEEDCPGFWALRDELAENGADDPFVIRATSDLAGQLARALVRFCNRPIDYETPAGQTETWDGPAILGNFLRTTDAGDRILELHDSLREEPPLLGRVLNALAAELPWQLLVVIDQGEDLVTPPGEEERPDLADLEMLGQAAAEARNCTVILSMRTHAFGAVSEALGPHDARRVASLYLPELDEERLVQAILWPTAADPISHTAEVPNAVYDFLFEEGLAETITREALRKTRGQGGTLPLLQTLCARLYRRLAGRPDRVIREDDLKKLGGVRPALSKYLEEIVRRDLRRGERRAVRALLERLCDRLADGTRFGRPLRWGEAAFTWQKEVSRLGGRPFTDAVRLLTDDDSRLLHTEMLAVDGKEHPYVSVAHEALAEVAEETAEQGRTQKYGRSRIADTLWIMIPLTVLVASLVYTLTTRAFSPLGRDLEKVREKQGELTELLDAQRYQAILGQAEQALRGGNSLRARQVLKEVDSIIQRVNVKEEAYLSSPLAELRGFEWYYLWKQVHPERRTVPGFIGTYPCLAVSADGKTLAVGGASPGPPGEPKLGVVKFYDAATGNFREEKRLHAGPVLAVALSADGTAHASAGETGSVVLWHGKDKSVIFDLREHKGPVRALAFSADGKTLASGGDDSKVVLWDVADGKKRQVFTEHTGAVEALAYSPKDQTLASAGADKTVILWEAASGKKRAVLKEHTGAVHALAFTRDGKTLASGGARPDGTPDQGDVYLWDAEKGGSKAQVIRLPEVFTLAFGSDSNTLYVGGKDNGVWIFDMAKAERKDIWFGHFGWVRNLLVSPDGKTLVTASYDRTVKIWDTEPSPTRLRGDGAPVQAVAFAGDGKTVASGDRDGTTYVWDLQSTRPRQQLKQPKSRVAGVALSRSGKLVVTAAWDPARKESTLTLWSAADGKVLKTQPANQEEVTCLALSSDGKTLASGGTDKRVKLWRLDEDKATLEVGRALAGHTAAVRCLSFFGPEGGWLASGDDAHDVWFWECPTGKKLADPRHDHVGPVLALAAVSTDNSTIHFIASAGTERSVWIVRPPTERDRSWRPWTWRGLAGVPLALAYTPDGRTLAVAGSDRCITVWDAMHDEPRMTLTGHTQPITCLAFAPDGRTLVSGGLDGDVRVWRGEAK